MDKVQWNLINKKMELNSMAIGNPEHLCIEIARNKLNKKAGEEVRRENCKYD